MELKSIMVVKESRSDLRQGRVVGVVIAVAMILWLLAQWLGPYLGLPGRYALLIDFLALVAFLWAIVSGILMWRASKIIRNID
jgi:uncharacterized iron-regulated membrane protein